MSDDSKPSTIGGAVARGLRSAMGRARTWQPGRVESYDAATGRAVVQPLIGRRVRGEDGEATVEHDPPIPGVEIGFPGAGGARFRFPIAAGDHVLLLFCERSLDRFKGGARGKIDPGDSRRHNASDAIAIPVDLANLGSAAEFLEFTLLGKVHVGGTCVETPGALNEGVVLGSGIDSFTGTPYSLLGSASTKVFAKKT